MARGHPVAVAIKQQAGEQARLRCSSASVALGDVAGKPRLNGIPQLPIDDWLSNGAQSGPRIGMEKGPLAGIGTGLSR
jgi:hypothetical protein